VKKKNTSVKKSHYKIDPSLSPSELESVIGSKIQSLPKKHLGLLLLEIVGRINKLSGYEYVRLSFNRAKKPVKKR